MKPQMINLNGCKYDVLKNYKGLYSLGLNKKRVGFKYVMDDFGNLNRLFYIDRYEHSIS